MTTFPRPLDVLERLISTAWQAGVAAVPVNLILFLSHPPDGATPLKTAGLMALSAALAAVVTALTAIARQALSVPVEGTVANLVNRFGWTAVAGFVGAMPTSFVLTETGWAALGAAGAAAAVAAVLSLGKNLTASGTIANVLNRPLGR